MKLITLSLLAAILVSCGGSSPNSNENKQDVIKTTDSKYQKLVSKYTDFKLAANIDHLNADQKKMLRLLIEAAKVMDDLFWYEAYGEKEKLLDSIQDPNAKKFVEINYGPWDRLDDNQAFIDGIGDKPKGANYYPVDMTKEEFEKANLPDKAGLYNFIRRNEKGELTTVPFHVQFKEQVNKAATLLQQASELAQNEEFKKYLTLRSNALLSDNYQSSDMAWMDMKTNPIDIVIGPIETYEDKLFGYKAAHEAYVLIKDMEWSKKLEKFATFLPELQKNLPVPNQYKQEKPGKNADLNAYDVIYYAGDCNSGSKTIAINLPNDEEVQLKKGSRRLQLKNAMRAKFDKILNPIADELIANEQRNHITFDAFFSNTMFHEVAHGLGIKETINKKGTVREALKEHASALEEGKADILGLYMITQLHKKGEISGDLKDYYVTFMAGIFRSVRFGAASAHGTANMIRFNFFKEKGAFTKNESTGKYTVNFEKLQEAMDALSEKILTLQGNGDYDGVATLVENYGKIGPELEKDLNKLNSKNIPVDVVFEQGAAVLGI